MTASTRKKILRFIFKQLRSAYGPQHWWPADTPFEMMVGAILTQNTSWKNVEKAMGNLKRKNLLSLKRLSRYPKSRLADAIRPAGFFNLKAERLREYFNFIREHYGSDFVRMRQDEPGGLRKKLLSVKGIGPETADSILLYAFDKPFFVVDAYTRRILSRYGLILPDASYEEIQTLFMRHLPRRAHLYNEYHALLVELAKRACKKTPCCRLCPIRPGCRTGKGANQKFTLPLHSLNILG